MRFLHTADWHIGKLLRGRRRDDEYRAALAQVLDIARHEQVDCLLVAGDVCDSQVPPPEAEHILFEFFRELWGAGIPAVIIGGNHDHPRRLGALGRILDLVGFHIRGEPLLPEEGGILELPSRDGREAAAIAALPWVPERKVIEFESYIEALERPFQQYDERIGAMLRYLARRFRPDTVNILIAHLMIEGATVGPGGGERPIHIGQTYAVNAQQLPAQAQYIALGHVHKPQQIVAAAPCRYAGSLLQLDFGERDQDKSVVLIDAAPGRPARIEPIPITSGRPLRDISGTLEELRRYANSVDEAYLRVTVRVERPLPGISEQVKDLFPNALEVTLDYPRAESTDPDSYRGLRHLGPLDLFAAYYRDTQGTEPSPPLLALFRRLYEACLERSEEARPEPACPERSRRVEGASLERSRKEEQLAPP